MTTQDKNDAAILADLTAAEREAIINLDLGVTDIDVLDAKALRLAGLIEGTVDPDLTERGARIAAAINPPFWAAP